MPLDPPFIERLQIFDCVESTVREDSSECEIVMFLKSQVRRETVCVRVRGTPFTAYVGPLPEDDRVDPVSVGAAVNQSNVFERYDKGTKTVSRHYRCVGDWIDCKRTKCATCTPPPLTHNDAPEMNPFDEADWRDGTDAFEDFSAPPPVPEPATEAPAAPTLMLGGRSFTENMCSSPCVRTIRKDEGAWNLLFVDRSQIVKRKPLIGYSPNPRTFVKVQMTRPFHASFVQKALNGLIELNDWKEAEVCGIHNNAVIAFLYATVELDTEAETEARGAAGFNWMECPSEDRRVTVETQKKSVCAREYVIDFREIKIVKAKDEPIAHAFLYRAGIDIETDTVQGRFPKYDRDRVFSITLCVGEEEKKVGFTWGRPIPPSDDKDATLTLTSPDERTMFLAFADFFRKCDADVLTGYNAESFDWPYLFGRSEVLGVASKFKSKLSRLKNFECALLKTTRFTNQSGSKEVVFLNVPGVVFMDMYPFVRSTKALREYKLDFVANAILQAKKDDMPYEEINPHFYGTDEMRRKLVEYCATDSQLALRLMKKLQALLVLQEESKIGGVLPRHRLECGLQLRLQRALFDYCVPAGYLIAKHKRIYDCDDPDESRAYSPFYEKFEAMIAARTPVEPIKVQKRQTSITDYFSAAAPPPPPPQYPDDEDCGGEDDSDDEPVSRGSYAYDVDSDQQTKRSRMSAYVDGGSSSSGSKRGVKRKADEMTPGTSTVRKRKKAKYTGATVLEPVLGYYKTPTMILDFNSLYPSIAIAHNLSHDTLLPPDNDFPADKKIRTPMGYEFVKREVHEGILPLMLRRFLAGRAAVRKQMKTETDPAVLETLNGRQGSMKVMANSGYGACGATTGALWCTAVAESITAFGRESIDTVVKYVSAKGRFGKVSRWQRAFDENKKDVTLDEVTANVTEKDGEDVELQVVAGDTDSCFINVKNMSIDLALFFGPKIVDVINGSGMFGSDQKIGFESVYCPLLILAKKKYAAMKYEKLGEEPSLTQKGTVGVRRDNARFVSEVLTRITELLMERDAVRALMMRRVFPPVNDRLRARIVEEIKKHDTLEAKLRAVHARFNDRRVYEVLTHLTAQRGAADASDEKERVKLAKKAFPEMSEQNVKDAIRGIHNASKADETIEAVRSNVPNVLSDAIAGDVVRAIEETAHDEEARAAAFSALFPSIDEATIRDPKACVELYVRRRIYELLSPKMTPHGVSIPDLTLTKNFTKRPEEYKNPDTEDHIRVYRIWEAGDHSVDRPVVGSRIPFLMIKTPDLKDAKGCDKARPPYAVNEQNVDYRYYFEKKLVPPMVDVLKVFFSKERLGSVLNVQDVELTATRDYLGRYVGPEFRQETLDSYFM